jgi:adenylate kinase family enzyme
MRILISGGPGSGCTSTAKLIGAELSLPVFDSDTFFHKPTDPPFQEQYPPAERRQLIAAALDATSDWILSGSIATWDVDLPTVHFGVFLDIPKEERLRRLGLRERERFGSRIDIRGDLHTENKDFMKWASGYEDRLGRGRNRNTDKAFLVRQCEYFIEISHSLSLDEIASEIRGFLANPRSTIGSPGVICP